MNFKSILTKTISTFFLTALLLVVPTFAQTTKTKQAMTPEQIEAFLKKAREKGWQITIKTASRKFSGTVHQLLSNESVTLADKHFFIGVGPCGSIGPGSTNEKIMLTDIVAVGKRNLPLYALRSTGEASVTLPFSAVFIAIALPAVGIQSAMEGLRK